MAGARRRLRPPGLVRFCNSALALATRPAGEPQIANWRWWSRGGTEVAGVTPAEADAAAAAIINGQRRRSLGYQSPATLYAALTVHLDHQNRPCLSNRTRRQWVGMVGLRAPHNRRTGVGEMPDNDGLTPTNDSRTKPAGERRSVCLAAGSLRLDCCVARGRRPACRPPSTTCLARQAVAGAAAAGRKRYGYALHLIDAPMATAASRAPRATKGAVTSRGRFWMVTSLGSSVKTLRSWPASSAL